MIFILFEVFWMGGNQICRCCVIRGFFCREVILVITFEVNMKNGVKFVKPGLITSKNEGVNVFRFYSFDNTYLWQFR